MPRLSSLLLVSALVTLPARAHAQCATQWLPGDGLPGADRQVLAATMWDRDGAGPQPSMLVVGGSFTTVGTAQAGGIAAYDFATGLWSPLGSGMVTSVQSGLSGTGVTALATLPNGDLVAGGDFISAGGVPANCIARWDGTRWWPFGSGMSGAGSQRSTVHCLKALPNGDLVAGGDFTIAGGVAANWLARWDGASWSSMGLGPTGAFPGVVSALATLPNGDLVAGGSFTTAAGFLGIARWNGSSWSALSTGFTGVGAMAVMPSGVLVAAGSFNSGAINHVAKWDGEWSALGSGMDGLVFALTTLPNGDIVAGGSFTTAGGVSASGIARWDGAGWSALGSGMTGSTVANYVHALTASNDDLVAGGAFTSAGGVQASNIARWSGATWSSMGSGMNGEVRAVAVMASGDVVAGGDFTRAGNVPANFIARWNGAAWSALGSGLNGRVSALITLASGDVVAGGTFTTAGGSPAHNIARWNGTTWSALGAGITGTPYYTSVRSLTTLANGDLVAGGQFTTAGGSVANNIARWNGSTWSALGAGMSGTIYAAVDALTTLPNGDLVAGGHFSTAGGIVASGIARWGGSGWSALGSGLGGGSINSLGAYSLAPLLNGDLVAGGYFGTAGGVIAYNVARWNGTTWSAMGSGMFGAEVRSLATLPNGDVVAAGWINNAGGASVNNIARWSGASWSAVGSGLGGGYYGKALALATLSNGDLAAGGSFLTAGGLTSAYFARLGTTCPATVTALGVGCPSSGGANTVTATLPWIGATLTVTATGVPSSAVVFAFHSLASMTLPLALVLAQEPLGCTLHVPPQYYDLVPAGLGTARWQFLLPNSPVIAGTVFHHQMLPFEIGSTGSIVAVTATNALSFRIGSF